MNNSDSTCIYLIKGDLAADRASNTKTIAPLEGYITPHLVLRFSKEKDSEDRGQSVHLLCAKMSKKCEIFLACWATKFNPRKRPKLAA
jgi:hypothetical protein